MKMDIRRFHRLFPLRRRGGAERFAPCPPPALRAPPLPAQNALPPSLLEVVGHCFGTGALDPFTYLWACSPRQLCVSSY